MNLNSDVQQTVQLLNQPMLKEVDSIVWPKFDNRLLPVFRHAILELVPPMLPFAVLRSHLLNLDVEQLFDCPTHIKLRRELIDLERILIMAG